MQLILEFSVYFEIDELLCFEAGPTERWRGKTSPDAARGQNFQAWICFPL